MQALRSLQPAQIMLQKPCGSLMFRCAWPRGPAVGGAISISSGTRAMIHGTSVRRAGDDPAAGKFVQEADDSSFERLVLQSKVPVLVDFYAEYAVML